MPQYVTHWWSRHKVGKSRWFWAVWVVPDDPVVPDDLNDFQDLDHRPALAHGYARTAEEADIQAVEAAGPEARPVQVRAYVATGYYVRLRDQMKSSKTVS